MSNTPDLEPELTRFFAGVDEGVPIDVEKGMHALNNKIDQQPPISTFGAARSIWNKPVVGVIAGLLIVTTLFSLYRKALPRIPVQNPALSVYETGFGERAKITLPDGSQAILAPVTTLQSNGRNIELSGEAVFIVNQHTNTPFIVKAGGVMTRVLGTTFGVRAYDMNVRVAVQDGKVSVDEKNALSAGDVVNITYTKTNVQHGVDVNALLSWVSGDQPTLEYRGALLADILPELSRWYAVDIRLADTSLGTQRFTGTLKPGSVAELANILELTYKVKVTRVGNVLTLGS